MNGELLKSVLEEQRQLLQKYEKIVFAYEKSDLVKEHKQLEEDFEKLKEQYSALNTKYEKVSKEAEKLRWSLQEQILSEKVALVDRSEEKAKILLANHSHDVTSTLKQLEVKLETKLDILQKQIEVEIKEDKQQLLEQIKELRKAINIKIEEKKLKLAKTNSDLLEKTQEKYKILRENPITEEAFQNRMKANNLEIKIGLHCVNKLGILVILMGIVAIMRYSFTYYMSDWVKGLFGGILTVAFLGGGAYCARKGKRIFSQGLIGGGIGIGYITIFCSYFILGLINIPIALGLCVMISVLAFALSVHYDSKTISMLALMGGYLPLLAYSLVDFGIVGHMIYISMGYVFMLNIVALVIAYKKNWPIVHYLSFFSNMPTSAVLACISSNRLIAVIYIFVLLIMYILMLVVELIRNNGKIGRVQRVIVAINVVFSGILIGIECIDTGKFKTLGIICILMGVGYYGLSLWMNHLQLKEHKVQTIFNSVALLYAIGCFPCLIEIEYISIAWLIQGLVFILYGLRRGNRQIETAGKVILGLSIWGYYHGLDYMVDSWFRYMNYTSIIGVVVTVLIFYLYKHRQEIEEKCLKNMGLILYKYFTIFLVWSYLLTMGAELIVHKFTFISDILTIKLLGIYLISAFILRLMRKVRFLQDEYTWNITVIGFALIDCICVVNNLYEQDYNSYVMCIVMIIWNLIDLGDIKTWFKEVVARFSLNVELYPLALAIYAIANTRIIMENQLSLGFHSIVVTLFYLVSALTLIILGFKYGYRWIRYGGLLLSLLSLAKLFMLDIATGVEGMYKILSYFCFGIVLLVISYIYQRFSKQIEMDMPQILTKKTEKETI